MPGVAGEEPQDHLQAAPAGASSAVFASGLMSLAGSFAGTGLRAVTAAAAAARARVMLFSRPGMRAFVAARPL